MPVMVVGWRPVGLCSCGSRFWHASWVDASDPEKREPEPEVPDRVRSDGRAAIAITLLAVLLIAFLISRLV
jgi:hypothetical protein